MKSLERDSPFARAALFRRVLFHWIMTAIWGCALSLFPMSGRGQAALTNGMISSTPPASDSMESVEKQPAKPSVNSEGMPIFQTFNSGSPDGKLIALTFDDGPHAVITPKLLDLLYKHKTKATFFVLGERVRLYPMILKQISDEGHEIGNHSYSHASFSKLSTENIERETSETQSLIKQTIGYEPSLFRPPYGAFRPNAVPSFQKHNLNVIMWSVDSRDWSIRDEDSIYDTVIARARGGSIVLFHDIHPGILDALPHILNTLIADGYQFVTVSELCGLSPAPVASTSESLSHNMIR